MTRRLPLAMVLAASLLSPLAGACAGHPDAKPGPRRIEISVTERGFEPDKITVKRGEPITLGFTRKTDQTCARSVELHTSDKDKVVRDLPLGQRVEIAVAFPNAGELRYACSMDMVTGVVQVQ